MTPQPYALADVKAFLFALGEPPTAPSEFISEIYPWRDQT